MQQLNYTPLHSAARAYAAAGIPVFPCVVGGKRPITATGFHEATTDLEQIDRWWSQEDFNVAFCPDDAGLFVVDIDPGAPDVFIQTLPLTYVVSTPRGGKHFYYEGSGKTTSQRLAPKVDTRGKGGYVLLPPSFTEAGNYNVIHEIAYAPIPDWIPPALAVTEANIKAATETEDLPVNVERAIKYLQREKPGVEFAGSDHFTFIVASKVKDLGISQEKTFDLMVEHWMPRCEGTWDEEFIRLKILNAYTHGQNDVGVFAVGDTPEEFSKYAAENKVEEKKSRFYFKNEEEQDSEPDPKWLVRELISERSTVMIYGKSGSFKSFLVLDICLSIATGKPTFGSETKPGLVFYGALEGKAHLKKGRKAWRVLKNIEGKINNFYVGRAPVVCLQEEMDEFALQINERCKGQRPTLIVIDTLSKSMAGMNENDASDANRFIQFCDGLVEVFGCTVISVHHASDKDDSRGARGSSAFVAGFDTVLEVKRPNKDSNVVSVMVKKHKDAEERKLPWTFEGKALADSLVFEEVPYEQFKMLAGESKDITTKTVGQALKKLNAFGKDNAVTTAVLAMELAPMKADDSIEHRADTLSRTSRALTALAKDALEAYCEKEGRAYLWMLPTPGA